MSVRMGAFPMEALRHINEQLHADLPRGRFITAWMGLLDSARGTLLMFSAGQGPLLHYLAAEDRFERFNADAPPLGVLPQVQFEPGPARVLAPGDLFAVISDGVFEAEDARHEAFGADRVEAVLRAHRHEPPEAILEALREAVRAYCGPAPIQDDRTAILIRRC
jgi:phosphoserine phosphatase